MASMASRASKYLRRDVRITPSAGLISRPFPLHARFLLGQGLASLASLARAWGLRGIHTRVLGWNLFISHCKSIFIS